MMLNNEYVSICDKFEFAVERTAQLGALAVVIEDAMQYPDNNAKAIVGATSLLAGLLREQQVLISELQRAHIDAHIARAKE
ncbi:MAG: hypothetical protein LBN30_10965 [Oscillospiraceae bacterium]|jgi:hypothetical protein|nr:hypothetical protein [Oscillospiraceae bacterium]